MREFKFEKRLLKLNLDSEADESVFREIFLDTDYMIVNDLIRRAPHAIIDIGGHIGLFSMYARGLNERVPIFVYEPEPRNFAALKEHFKINHLQNAVIKNVAVAAADGLTSLYLSEDSHNHSLGPLPGAFAQTIKVPTVSMSAIFRRDLAKQRLDFCDLVKMDCEGAEFEILPAMNEALFARIGTFYVEYHEYPGGPRKEELIQIFKKMKFKIRVTPSRHDARFGFILAMR